MISNQKYNAYLKEIADICGIDKNLITHVARRTFATVAADLRVPAETIRKVIGHKGFNHLHLYNKSGQAKISQDMEVFSNKDWGSTYQVIPRAAIQVLKKHEWIKAVNKLYNLTQITIKQLRKL